MSIVYFAMSHQEFERLKNLDKTRDDLVIVQSYNGTLECRANEIKISGNILRIVTKQKMKTIG